MSGAGGSSSGERGASLVEFAVVALLFLTVLFACFEFSRIVLVYTAVTNSARMGVRAATVRGSLATRAGAVADDPVIVSAVRDAAAAATMKTANITVHVNYPSGDNNPGSTVQVTVSYLYDAFSFLSFGGLTLRASTQGVISY